MAINTILYPVDTTGTAASNRVIEEPHVIGIDRYRAFALNGGPFFVNDQLIVTDANTNQRLIMGRDFTPLYDIPELTKIAHGKRICGVIMVHNKNVGTNIKVSYNLLGGPYTSMVYVIKKAIEDLELDNRNVYWRRVLEKPDLFQAGPHDHDVGDVFGFEYHIAAIDALREAVNNGNTKVTDTILDKLDSDINTVKRLINDHKLNKSNPHQVTPHQINCYDKTEINNKLAAIQKQFEDLEPRFTDILKKIKTNADSINATNTNVVRLGERVSDVERRFGNYNNVVAELNSKIDEINENLDLLKARVDQHDVDINNLSGQINALIATDARHDAELTQIRNSINSIVAVNNAQQAEIDALKRRDDDLQRQINNLVTKNNQQDSSINSVIGVNNSQNGTLNSLQQQIDALKRTGANIEVRTGNDRITGLTAGKRYVVIISGVTGDRGVGGAWLGGTVITDSGGNVIASTNGLTVNWPDGNAPQSGAMYVTAPSNGEIRGRMDWNTQMTHTGACKPSISMLAFKVG